MPLLGLRAIGAAETVPPGEIEAEVAVGLAGDDRMMDPVHVRRHQDQPQEPVCHFRHPDVAVIELGCRIQHNLEDDDRHCRRPDQDHCRQLDADGNDDLDGMETVTGGDVDIEVRVVHAVEAPEDREEMEQHVLKVNDEIEGHDSQDDRDPLRQGDAVQHAPAPLPGQVRHADRDDRQEETDHRGIDHHQGKVGEPAPSLAVGHGTPGSDDLPDADARQDAEEERKPDDLFVVHSIVLLPAQLRDSETCLLFISFKFHYNIVNVIDICCMFQNLSGA